VPTDDIECKITVDGNELRYINNDDIGDFEQDAIRDLNQWIPDLVPYFEGVEFKVIELDDIGHDDTLTARALRDEGHWLHGWSGRYPYRTEATTVTTTGAEAALRLYSWAKMRSGRFSGRVSARLLENHISRKKYRCP
jgi:hypothetical protein